MASQPLFSAETVFHRLQKIPISVTATQGRRPAVRAMNIKLSLPDLSWRKPIPRLTAPHHSWVINLQYISKGPLSLTRSLVLFTWLEKRPNFRQNLFSGPEGLFFVLFLRAEIDVLRQYGIDGLLDTLCKSSSIPVLHFANIMSKDEKRLNSVRQF